MRGKLIFRGVAVLWIGALAHTTSAQDYTAPNPPLAELARQSRAQHAAAEGQPNKAQELVDEMQQQQEQQQVAPTGFKSYDAGDYRLFVPFPYDLEGRDNTGAVLIGSRLGLTNTEVMAGSPVPIRPNLNDNELLSAANQLASSHGQPASCSQTKLGERKAFRCGWQNSPSLLGRQVWGSIEIVATSNSLIPVMCVSPDDVHQPCVVYDTLGHNSCNDRNAWKTRAAIEASYRDERTTTQICDQIIYPSITLKEDIVVHPAVIGQQKPANGTTGTVPQDNSVAAYGVQTGSLAELARQSRQASHGQPLAKLSNAEGGVAPAGFQSFSLQYCQYPQHCSTASIVIPEKSEIVSNANSQYIFKTVLNGYPVMLYAGPVDVNEPYRSMTNADYIRIRDLAGSSGWSREKADAVSTQELSIDGRPALMTRFRYQRDEKNWWIGERAQIQVQPGQVPNWQIQNGQIQTGQFLIGCTAPEQRFADAEVLCTTLVNSLRLQ